jgi:membrane fusion protein, multidrug efflux system
MNESPTPGPNPTPPSAPGGNGKSKNKLASPFFILPATVVLAVVLFFGLGLFFDFMTHESTDDAFIAGHIISVAPRVAGQVTAVHVLDNDLVHSNQLLVTIDPSDYAITVAQKQSAAESQNANYKTVVAAYQLMETKVATAEANARKAEADANASAADSKLAAMTFKRDQELVKNNTISQQEFDDAQAAAESAKADWNSAQQNAVAEESKVEEARAQLNAAEAEVGMALAQWRESQTNVAAARLDLSYTKIYAPENGRVTRKQVEVGDYLQAGQTIMYLVPKKVWVVANFKESQLRDMKPGQPVMVAIDALGGRQFRAHVDSIQAGSGAAFSLLPPENATGNFVKVVQRVPVKIVFDEPLPADHTIGPGLSVEPSVQISSFNMPDWATGLLAAVLAIIAAVLFRLALSRRVNGNGK